jgi:SAM-dependent methyltransferase
VKVSYHHYREFPGWGGAAALLRELIEREGSRAVLEIGSGANPTLAAAELPVLGIRYTTNDRSQSELAKADPAFATLRLDMAAAHPAELPREAFDLVFSRMVNEHVADGERYHRNIFAALRPGGVSAHCFSTLYALPFVVNRVLPERLAGRVLDLVNPREDPYRQAKFPARYSWSRGPTRRAIARLTAVGYAVEEYRGYFGHPYYDRPVLAPVRALEQAKAAWLTRHPVAALTSYGVVVLRKPGSR